MLNSDEPTPPIPRRTSSCSNVPEKPASRLDTPTIPIPIASPRRSPMRSTMRPLKGAETSRAIAKTATTLLAA